MKALGVVSDIVAELERAERKFPGWPVDPVHAAAVVVEEAGELQQAALQFTYEGGGFDAMYKEAVHTGAMALRFLLNVHMMKMRPSEQVERRKTATNKRSTPLPKRNSARA
jgi:NTP pyrophosphatase (non-canonical NTP hydrolase)